MKNILLFILLIVCGKNISGQNYNYAHHIGTETTYNMVGINSKSFYIEKSLQIPQCCMDKISLVGVGSDGKEIFRTEVISGAYMDYRGISVTVEKNLLVYAGTRIKGCDVYGDKFNLARIDTSGSIIWSITLNKRISFLLPQTDGSFFLIINNSLEHYTSQGVFISSVALNITNINGAATLNSGNILFNYNSGTSPRFRIVDTAGTMLSDLAASSVLKDIIETSDGSITGLSGQLLQKYSESLVLKFSTANTLPLGQSVSAYVSRNDTFFIAGQTTFSRPVYTMLDSNLNVLFQTISNVENAICTGITLSSNKINIITWGTSGTYPSQSFTGFFQTALKGNLDSKPDIGVTRVISVDSLYFPYGSQSWQPGLNSSVTVRNFGVDTVKSFHLNYYEKTGGTSYCLIGLNKLYNVIVPPGDSVTVLTGSFYSILNLSSVPLNQTVVFTICINASVPNSMNDIDVTNDFACAQIKLIPVGIKENAWLSNNVKIYPNPSDGEVAVNSDILINTIEIIDNTGKRVKNIEVNKNEFYLKNKSLSNGLYIFKINTDKGLLTKKVVIE